MPATLSCPNALSKNQRGPGCGEFSWLVASNPYTKRITYQTSWTSFCEARRASHCHSPQTTFSSNSTCCVLSTQKSAMHVVVYADRLTTQHSIVDIVHWSWSYWQFCYPIWHVECFWAALAAHWISSASHTSVLPQHPRRKIVPYRVGWNHHTSDYYG